MKEVGARQLKEIFGQVTGTSLGNLLTRKVAGYDKQVIEPTKFRYGVFDGHKCLKYYDVDLAISTFQDMIETRRGRPRTVGMCPIKNYEKALKMLMKVKEM
jgi:hypothetical protein